MSFVAPHPPHHQIRDLADYRATYRESLENPALFWGKQARRIDWFHEPSATLEVDSEEADFGWFVDGRLNVNTSCVDRHARATPRKPAIIWAGNEPGQYRTLTYLELRQQVGRLANVLRAHGVRKGDRVCLYLPMIPEAAIAMLACARIGAVHSVIFGGFSAESLRDRILDAGCKLLLTANEAPRGPRNIPLKEIADQAVEGLSIVETVLVVRRTAAEVPMREGRDFWLESEMDRQRAHCPAEWMDSEDPLFVLYTSGSTGKPKGLLHTTGGYLVYATATYSYVFDAQPQDIHLCTADVGWVTGHSYVVYGPLANGVTTVMMEAPPTYPDASRLWQIVDDLKVTVLYTSPTALRSLRRAGDAPVKKTARSSLRLLGSVGEPIDADTWNWFHDVCGDGRCDIVDTWWQTESGGILISPLPGITPMKPGSATLPLFGVQPLLLDEAGKIQEGNPAQGNLALAGSWPGQARSVYGSHRRFRETYFARYPNLYFTGDGCRRDEDGYYWITGRVDDVLNVSGHRLGTAELETALMQHETVAEAAVVGFPHDIKGTGILAYVVLKPGRSDFKEGDLIGALKEQVRHAIGPIATPDRIEIVSGLPKTRSGKVMRRILRQVALGKFDQLGDITTLVDPSIVDELIANARKYQS
jgi:acetyl-CoA synthetase